MYKYIEAMRMALEYEIGRTSNNYTGRSFADIPDNFALYKKKCILRGHHLIDVSIIIFVKGIKEVIFQLLFIFFHKFWCETTFEGRKIDQIGVVEGKTEFFGHQFTDFMTSTAIFAGDGNDLSIYFLLR